MQQYFLKSLVGLFLMVTTCHFAPVHALSFLRALVEEEADVADREALVETNIDPVNQLEGSRPEGVVKNSAKNNFIRKFVTVQLGVESAVEVEEGKSYELRCKVDANPGPRVYWIRGDNPTKQIEQLLKTSVPSKVFGYDSSSLSQVQSKYIIDCASKQDEGRIACVAIAGEKISLQSTVITVKESSNRAGIVCKTDNAPVITEHTSLMFSASGSKMILSCKAKGAPRPRTYWLDAKDERIDHYNSRYKVLPNGDLLIENLAWDDMGGYTCIAESSSGEARAETFLYPFKREEDSLKKERT